MAIVIAPASWPWEAPVLIAEKPKRPCLCNQNHSAGVQRSLEQEVGLEEGRLAAISLRSKCRKLESESLFAEVFEKYEEEIRQLQVTVRNRRIL